MALALKLGGGCVAAAILAAVVGGILPPGTTTAPNLLHAAAGPEARLDSRLEARGDKDSRPGAKKLTCAPARS